MPVAGRGAAPDPTGASPVGTGDGPARQPADSLSDRQKKPIAGSGVGDGSKVRTTKEPFTRRAPA